MFLFGDSLTRFIVTAQTIDLGPTRAIRPEERADYQAPSAGYDAWHVGLAIALLMSAALIAYLWRRRATRD